LRPAGRRPQPQAGGRNDAPSTGLADPRCGWYIGDERGWAVLDCARDSKHGGRLVGRVGETDSQRSLEMSGILFHLAFPIHEIEAAKRFYVDGLGCTLGRESTHAVTFGLHDHQLVAHVVDQAPDEQQGIYPRHFGLVFLSKASWQALADRAKAKGLTFYQQPRVRFPGSRIEHHTFFLEDPSRNLLEFKHYTHESAIFGEHDVRAVGDTSAGD